jgi:lysozyme
VLISLLTAFAAVPAAQAHGFCTQWYTVQRGDTLFRLALRFGTSVAHLQSLNGIINANRIFAGQLLCVSTSSSGGNVYIVQRGDTLSRIARRFGVNLFTLANFNGITNINLIYAGQRLLIPV